ncbi:enoyl-CoA hydratase family protein [Streptomyces abikoensis]|uniref:enoyl-CoA hydratase family protein n=1 Tax=Streptomyces abikoensis TaxID=97398 RepID=UPI001672F666|nr:enoyl-CoA hydratase family protein [Streptomyces abikoensis]GGP61006.1 enoyl-CoA hydratase [Streptomyces abikoensis]
MPVHSSVHDAYERGVTTLTLDSPHNRNALSTRLVTELREGLARAADDARTRAVVLTHTGGTFCSGADLTEPAPTGPEALVGLLRTVVELPKPVVTVVRGHVRAGGLGLVGACDIALADETSTFAFTESRIGLAPAVISLPLLPRLDPRAASRYYLTGERFGAAEAARIGLITAVTSAPTDATDATDKTLESILDGLRRASPQGLAESKRLVTAEVLRAFDRDAAELAERSARLFASAEAREGMAAFLEKRDPAWAR